MNKNNATNNRSNVLRLESFEDLDKEVADGLDDLVVMVVERHFHIETHELSQVSVSVGILRPEHCQQSK